MSILNIVRMFIRFFNYFCMAYTLLLGVIYVVQLFVALKRVRRQDKRKISEDYMRYAESQNLLPISLLVPAHNEQENIVQNVKDLLGLEYLKAFESGREIVRSPQPHVHQFLAGVENATENARLAVSAAEQDFAGASGRIAGLVEEIRRQTEFLQRRLKELAAGVGEVSAAYTGFDRVREAALADIEEIRQAYEQEVGEYLKGDAAPPAVRPKREASLEEAAWENEPLQASGEEEVFQDAEAEPASEPVEPAPALMEELTGGQLAEPVPESAADGTEKEETGKADTAADFRDEEDAASWKDSQREGEDEEAIPARENSKEAIRGQNILNLLSKYQKR